MPPASRVFNVLRLFMRKLPVVSGVFVTGALLVAACGGTAAPTVPPVTIPSIAIPSFAIPSLGLGSFQIPSFAIPSFNGDPDLAAKFPKTINGATVSPPQTALYSEVFAALGGAEDALKFNQAMAAIGVNPATVSYGTADVDLNESETITAVRVPGSSASTLVGALPQLEQIFQPDEPAPVVGTTTLGGKSITTITDADGNVDYFYASGDTLWETDATDADDQSAIFGALQ
jgi:hypothetical protein